MTVLAVMLLALVLAQVGVAALVGLGALLARCLR